MSSTWGRAVRMAALGLCHRIAGRGQRETDQAKRPISDTGGSQGRG